VSLPDAVRSVLTQYANFQGRSRRSELWWYLLAYWVAYFVLFMIDKAVFDQQILSGLLGLAVLLPTLGVEVRRMHDTGRSGWWILLPIVNIVFWAQDSQPGTNKYGPSPKEAVAAV
jgi:uncharacterized membrane protein YhaH (DUF805 family)